MGRVDEKIILTAIDCTRHGVPGAFMSLIGHNVLTDIILNKKISQADAILGQLHVSIRYLLFEVHAKPLENQQVILEETLQNWIGDEPQIDDILVIGVKV